MKKKGFLLLMITLLLFSLSGCEKGPSADQYVEEQINAVKTGDGELFSSLLDKGIEKSNKQYVLQFPEELRPAYLAFLQEAFDAIDFQVSEARKNGDGLYSVQLSFKPVNIGDTTKKIQDDFLSGMASTDLNTEAEALLEASAKALSDSPAFEAKANVTLDVRKTEDGFILNENTLETLLTQTLRNYMAPYDAVCELLDTHGFLTAYLDASFKGEVTQFALYTDRTEDEALAWYEGDTFNPPDTMTAAYTDRYTAALKEIFRQCKYTVSIPRKENGVYNYTIDVTVIPNNSLLNTFSELDSGIYYSEEEVDKTVVELLEVYAAEPSYGEETVVTISLNMSTILNAGKDDSDLARLCNTIIPTKLGTE
ncbi:MAG: hypothetical protein K1W34_04700 [Lachnospiraceae bacterium]